MPRRDEVRRPPEPSTLLRAHEVAAALAVDVKTIRRWCRKGAMQAIVVGP